MASAYSYFCFTQWMDRPGRNLPRPGNITLILILSTFVELKTKEHGYAKGVAEVCKYALKFSDLSMENTFHAFLTLKGKRLTGSFGSMHGLKIDKAVPDEISKDDLPYMEMIYRFVFGPKSYYNLEITKDVKPQTKEWGGGGGTDDRHDRMTLWSGETSKSWSGGRWRTRAQYAPTATKLYKQAYPVATGLVRGSTLRPQRGALMQTFQVRQCSSFLIYEIFFILWDLIYRF